MRRARAKLAGRRASLPIGLLLAVWGLSASAPSLLERVGVVRLPGPVVPEGAVLLGTRGVVLQRSDRDCGVAAIIMLLNRRGIPVTYDSVARALPQEALTPRGVSLQDLADLAERFGLELSGFRFETLGAVAAVPPWLARLSDGLGGHYVLVERIAAARVIVLDPAVGRVSYRRATFERLWSRHVLLPRLDQHRPMSS